MMTKYPEFAQVKESKYKINTDYRVAIKCNNIAEDDSISDSERALAIIYLLYGDEGLKNSSDWEGLLKIGLKYLRYGKEETEEDYETEEVDMDLEQDFEYIKTSFFYDYGIKLNSDKYLHWWEFYNLLCGLSEKCILNRIRFVRNFDISQIKESRELEKWIEQKERFKLKEKKSAEEIRLDELFEKQLQKE